MCFYLRNWQVTFLLYTLGVKITEYIAKAPIEPRDYRVVFLIQETLPDFSDRADVFYFFTVTLIFTVFFPDLTVIVAFPAFFALITPFLDTVATFLLEDL